jgi:hypothetical protein
MKNPTIDCHGIVYCSVETPKDILPILPYRQQDGKLLFPLGKWKAYYTMDEVLYAIEQGYKIRLIHGFITDKTIKPFDEYVDTFYKARMFATSEQEKLFYKLLMNSLYGKYGTGKEKTTLIDERLRPLDVDSIREIYLGRYVLEKVDDKYPIYSNIIWASEVTSKARILLHKLMKKILDTNNMLLYCDTDSIMYCGEDIFISDKMLGGIKLENKESEVTIFGAKEYIFGNIVKAKGIPKKNQSEYLYTGKTTFQRPTRLFEALKRKIKPNVWIEVTKIHYTDYDKRIVKKDGTTIPYNINDLEKKRNE